MAVAERTEAKLRYANLILGEIQNHHGLEGDDFQRAHEEAFLFHLHGALDAFLHEINEHHSCGLQPDDVSIGRLQQVLKRRARTSPQLAEIRKLKGDLSHILGRIEEWRHMSTHRHEPGRHFFVGGDQDGVRRFNVPGGSVPVGKHIPDEFADALEEMRSLLKRLRADLAMCPP